MLITQRKVAIACRCQLLTGSYEDSTRSCPCLTPLLCKLSNKEREELKKHLKVVKAKKRNQEEYKKTIK